MHSKKRHIASSRYNVHVISCQLMQQLDKSETDISIYNVMWRFFLSVGGMASAQCLQ